MEMLGAKHSGPAFLCLRRFVLLQRVWVSGKDVLILSSPSLGLWNSCALCNCIPEGITAGEKILVTKSSQVELSSRTGASGAPGAPWSQDSPCLCSPLSLLQEFSCNVLYFAISASFWQRRGGDPALQKNQRGCAKVPGEGNALANRESFPAGIPIPWAAGPFLGAGSDAGGAERGQGREGRAFGTRPS